MKIKTSELTGAALDWAVAKTIAIDENQLSALRVKRGYPFLLVDGGNPYGPARTCNFSTDWAQGGPIIERERLNLRASGAGDWVASTHDLAHPERRIQYGPTALVAAMRCFISSRFGDEVEIPEELAC